MRNAALSLLLFVPLIPGCTSEDASAKSNPLQPPVGLEKAQLVKPLVANELTAAKAELGKVLFFDPRLSGSGKMGCVNCHYPDKAFTDGIRFSTKDNGGQNSRNSPTMYNVGYYPELYWDGRKTGLEANVLAAWTGQLDGKPAEVAGKLNAIDAYKQMFHAAFGKDAVASEETIVQALSAFLRSLQSGNSAYDKSIAQPAQKPLSAAQKAGESLFTGKAGCAVCHVPPLFTDKLYHNVGIGMTAEQPDTGRAVVEKDNDKAIGAFKTPTLREIARTGPYFHDGSAATLTEAVTLMASGGIKNDHLDPLMLPKGLSDEEIGQLVAFLESLNGDVAWTAPKVPQ